MPRLDRRGQTRLGCVTAVALALFVFAPRASGEEPSWATTRAAELTRQAAEHAAQGDTGTATRRLLDALSFDPTFGPAYVALGAMHEATGDVAEAERVYETGLERVPGFAAGHAARGKLRRRLGRVREAALDFEASLSITPDDAATLEALTETYVTLGALAAALSTSRRSEALAAGRGDEAALKQAKTRSRALAALLAEIDPVTAGARDRGPVRSALARLARRGR